ncbi:MAG: hypothetical protein ACLT5P_14250 [Flavonifractor plautii]
MPAKPGVGKAGGGEKPNVYDLATIHTDALTSSIGAEPVLQADNDARTSYPGPGVAKPLTNTDSPAPGREEKRRETFDGPAQ